VFPHPSRDIQFAVQPTFPLARKFFEANKLIVVEHER